MTPGLIATMAWVGIWAMIAQCVCWCGTTGHKQGLFVIYPLKLPQLPLPAIHPGVITSNGEEFRSSQ